MSLPSTGSISLLDVRNELGKTGTISLDDYDVRNLAGKTSGTISMSDLRGKSVYSLYMKSGSTKILASNLTFSKQQLEGGAINITLTPKTDIWLHDTSKSNVKCKLREAKITYDPQWYVCAESYINTTIYNLNDEIISRDNCRMPDLKYYHYVFWNPNISSDYVVELDSGLCSISNDGSMYQWYTNTDPAPEYIKSMSFSHTVELIYNY